MSAKDSNSAGSLFSWYPILIYGSDSLLLSLKMIYFVLSDIGLIDRSMKKISILVLFWFFYLLVYSQTVKPTIYNVSANASADILAAITKASAEGKHVLLQIGGNWCPWCIKLHQFFHSEQKIDSVLKAGYIFVLVNYSKENKNPEVLKKLEFPQRFGFPVLVVLDGKGKRLHTQDSGLLESGDGYDSKKVLGFLKGWEPGALEPGKYK
jgi:thioredoxin-related protein